MSIIHSDVKQARNKRKIKKKEIIYSLCRDAIKLQNRQINESFYLQMFHFLIYSLKLHSCFSDVPFQKTEREKKKA